MMIFKYPLEAVSLQAIEMPKGSKPLHVAMQNRKACLWALVYPDAEKELVQVAIYGTGHWIDEQIGKTWQYVGTVMPEENLVFHCFVKPS